MDNRETKKIITPIGKKEVILKAWVTGREKRLLRKPFLKAMKLQVQEGSPKIDDIDTSDLMDEAENLAIETLIISIGGKTDNLVETILDMKDKDYDFVINELNKITKDEDFTKPEKTQE